MSKNIHRNGFLPEKRCDIIGLSGELGFCRRKLIAREIEKALSSTSGRKGKIYGSGGFRGDSLELEGHSDAADDAGAVEVVLAGDLEVLDVELFGKAGNRWGQLAEDRR